MSERGSAIRFVAGKYEGRTGWFNMANAHTTSMYYVIVTMGENGEEKNTRVRKASVIAVADERVPVSYEEAVLQQHSDIDVAMNKLVASLAECGIQGGSTEITRILSAKLIAACVAQQMRGSKATWRYTTTTEEDNASGSI
jgi:hypothetical protein